MIHYILVLLPGPVSYVTYGLVDSPRSQETPSVVLRMSAFLETIDIGIFSLEPSLQG